MNLLPIQKERLQSCRRDKDFNGRLIDADYGTYGLPWASYVSH